MLEETGYDLENQLDPENVLQMSIREQSISLYIVPGVPEDFHFETRTRKEISVSVMFCHQNQLSETQTSADRLVPIERSTNLEAQ